MKTGNDKADWNDINNFSQQFDGIYLSNVSADRAKPLE